MAEPATGACDDDLTACSPHLALQQQAHSGIKTDEDGKITRSFDSVVQERDRNTAVRVESSSHSHGLPCAPEDPATVTNSNHYSTHGTGSFCPAQTPVLHDAGFVNIAVNSPGSQWPSSFGGAAGIHSSGGIVIPTSTPAQFHPQADHQAPSAPSHSVSPAALSHFVLNASRQPEGLDSPLMHAAVSAATSPPPEHPAPLPDSSIPSADSSRSHVPVAESSNEHADPRRRAPPPPAEEAAEPTGTPTSSAAPVATSDGSGDAAAARCFYTSAHEDGGFERAAVSMAPAVDRYKQAHPNFQDSVLDEAAESVVMGLMAARGEAARARTLLLDGAASGGVEGQEFGGALADAAASSSSADSEAVMHVRPVTPAPELAPSSPGGSDRSGGSKPMFTQESPCHDSAARVHAFAWVPGGGVAADDGGSMHAHSAAAQHSGPGPGMMTEWPSVQGPANMVPAEHSASPQACMRPSTAKPQDVGHAYGLHDRPSAQPRDRSDADSWSMHRVSDGSNPTRGPEMQRPGYVEPGYDRRQGAVMHGHLAPHRSGKTLGGSQSPAALQPRHMPGAGGDRGSDGPHPDWAPGADLAFSIGAGAKAPLPQPEAAWAEDSVPAFGVPRHVDSASPAVTRHTHAAASVHRSPASDPRTDTGRGRLGCENFGRGNAQLQIQQWSSEDVQFSSDSTQHAQQVRVAQHAPAEQAVVGRKQARGVGGTGSTYSGQEAPRAAALPDPDLLQQRVVALEAVVKIQEEQLLAAASQGAAAARPEIVTLLPRWRKEALRQYEQRLHAQLAAKEARAECERQRAAARAEVDSAHESAAAAERTAREAQLQSRLAHEQARAAAAAEGAARALAHDANDRAATAGQEAQRMHDAVVACMEGMHVAEGVIGDAMDKAASHLLRIEFAGERLTFAAKLWATRGADLLSLPRTSPSPDHIAGSGPHTRPLLLHAPPATNPARSAQHAGAATGHEALASAALVAQGSRTGQLMHREVATLRQDRDTLLDAMKELRTAFVRQVHSREAAAAVAGRELAEAEAEGRRREEQWREGAARSAEEHVLRNALRRAVAAAERQVLSAQGALSARLAQVEPRLWAAEDRVACVSRHLERERHGGRLAREQLCRKACTIETLQGECSRWQAAAAEATAATATAERGRADAASEAARARLSSAEAMADAERLRRVQGELEAEAARLRAEVEDAGAAVEEWERAAAEAEAVAAEEAEEWERQVVELREEVEKWQESAAEAVEAARSAASQQLHAEADMRKAELEAEQSCAALKRTHADVLAGLRQRHEEEVQRLQRELEGRGREVQSARRERNALLSALRDADRRAASSADGATGGGVASDSGAAAAVTAHHPSMEGHAYNNAEVPGVCSADAPSLAIRHLGAVFIDADETAGHMHASHASVPAHEVGPRDTGISPQRSPLVATTISTKAVAGHGAGAGGKAAGAEAAMRGRQSRPDMHAGHQVPRERNPVRSSSHLGKRARQDSSIASDDSEARGNGQDVKRGEGLPNQVATGAHKGETMGPQSISWLQGAAPIGRPRMSTHGDEAWVHSSGPRDREGDYGDWEDSDADVAGHSVNVLPPQRAQRRSLPDAAAARSSVPQVPPQPLNPSGWHAATRRPAARKAGTARFPDDQSQEKSPREGSEGGPSSDSEAEEDARMLRRAAHAAGVPLDLVAPGQHRCAAPEKPVAALSVIQARRRAIVPEDPDDVKPGLLAGAGDGNRVSRGDTTVSKPEAGVAREALSPDPISSGSRRGHALPRSMAQAAGAWPAPHADNADDVARSVHAGGHTHALRSPGWEATVHAADRRQPPVTVDPAGAAEKPRMHDDAWRSSHDSSRLDAPDRIAASSDWISIADSAHTMGAEAKHAQHAPWPAEYAFRITHRQPQPALARRPHAYGAVGLTNSWPMHEEHAGQRHARMAAAAAQNSWRKATVMMTGQGAAPPASSGDATAAAAPARGTTRESAEWQQNQAGGIGGLWSAAAQAPQLGGGAETHHSTLRDRFQVFPRPDCSFSEFHNLVFDSTRGEDSARDIAPDLLHDMQCGIGNPSGDGMHGGDSDQGRSGEIERALVTHATHPSASGYAAGMQSPFSRPPSASRSRSGAASCLSAPPSAPSSSAAPSDLQGPPRRPESIFDELSAPSLQDESSMHACTARETLPTPAPCPGEQNSTPATAPRPTFHPIASQIGAPTDGLPQHAAQHAVAVSVVSVLSLVPPNNTTAAPKQLARPPRAPSEPPHMAPPDHDPPRVTKTQDDTHMHTIGNAFDQALFGARSTSSHLSFDSATDPTLAADAVPFPLMCSQQVQSSELPASLVLPRKLAKAAAVSATAAAARASRETCDLEGPPLASPDDMAATARDPAVEHVATGAPLGASPLQSLVGRRVSGGMHARVTPVAATAGAGVHALQGLRGAAAVPPRTPLATGAARMLTLRAAAVGRSGASPHTHDTSRDVSLAAAVRPPGAGARRSLPFSDEDLTSRSVLSLEASEDDAGIASHPGEPDAACPPKGAPVPDAAGDSAVARQPITRSMHSMTIDDPAPRSVDVVGNAAEPVHGSRANACHKAHVEEMVTLATRTHTHERQHAAALRPSVPPEHPLELGSDTATAAEDGHPRRNGAIAGFMHVASGGDEGNGVMMSIAAELVGSDEEEGQKDAPGSDGAPEEVLQGRLHALDGDLRRMMQRLRMSWDGVLGDGGSSGATADGRSRAPGRGATPLPGHGSCPADTPCAAPDESSVAVAGFDVRAAKGGESVGTGSGVQDAEEHEPPCMNVARGSPESALDPTPSPPKVASEMVPGCDRAERRTLLPPSLVVPEVLQHQPPHMHAGDAHAATVPRASGGPATEGTLLLHSQAPAAAPEAPSRSAVRGVDEVVAAGTWSAGDTESPTVKEVWETQCRGLSTRRRR